jgi:hypothetical protein
MLYIDLNRRERRGRGVSGGGRGVFVIEQQNQGCFGVPGLCFVAWVPVWGGRDYSRSPMVVAVVMRVPERAPVKLMATLPLVS